MRSSTGIKPFRFNLAKKLFYPVDNSPLVLFRILFGLILCYHCLDFIVSGDLYENFIQPPFTFSYIGFEFLQPLPGPGMYYYFALMALFALMVMLGAWYRFSMIGFTILWAGIYLMQKSNYNNHYYLVLLLCSLMSIMPANRYVSIDVKRNAVTEKHSCAQWVIVVFILQIAVVYFYAGISKLSGDWLSGKFIALQFARLTTHRFVGPFYASRPFQLLICYGGLFFDLFIVPLLLWKKTRRFAFLFYCGFHLFNSYTFRIGIFPYLSIAMGVFFLDGEFIRHRLFKNKRVVAVDIDKNIQRTFKKQLLLYVLGIYFIFQLILPMRSWFFPGNVFWTEEGYRMSWKMMLRGKTGKIHFKVVDTVSQKTWRINPAEKFIASHVTWIAICPDIAWQYAQRLKKEYNDKGYPNVKVYAIDSVSLNKYPPQLLIDTTVDLGAVQWQPFRHSNWILPYTSFSH